MDREELLDLFSNVTIWKKGDKRAPHKPLLILYMLGRLQRGKIEPVYFDEMDGDVSRLLNEFGPPRKTQPLYPFWYLQNDGLWQLTNIEPSDDATPGPCPTKSFMRNRDVRGHFPTEIEHQLSSDHELLKQVAMRILEDNFPATLHSDILQTAGLDMETSTNTVDQLPENRRTRDPRFRERVLRAYEYRCVVCGFNVRLGNTPVGLEAAHIKWHQAGGPDEECNGLALCSLHHKLFDRGVFSLNPERRLIVSDSAHGNEGFEEWLMRFHGTVIKPPQRSSYTPLDDFTEWHISEVFKGKPRELIISQKV